MITSKLNPGQITVQVFKNELYTQYRNVVLRNFANDSIMKDTYRNSRSFKSFMWWKPYQEDEMQYMPLWLSEYDRRTLLRPASPAPTINTDLLGSSKGYYENI